MEIKHLVNFHWYFGVLSISHQNCSVNSRKGIIYNTKRKQLILPKQAGVEEKQRLGHREKLSWAVSGEWVTVRSCWQYQPMKKTWKGPVFDKYWCTQYICCHGGTLRELKGKLHREASRIFCWITPSYFIMGKILKEKQDSHVPEVTLSHTISALLQLFCNISAMIIEKN